MTTLADLRELLKRDDPAASDARESVLAFEKQDWVVVFHEKNDDDGFGSLRMACFLQSEAVEHSLANSSFDLGPGDGRPGFVGYWSHDRWVTEYSRVGDGESIPLVINRYPNGPFPRVVELTEDFRLSGTCTRIERKRRF